MKIAKYLVASTLLVTGFGIAGQGASAEGGEYESSGTITFAPYTGITPPVDPENPGEEANPEPTPNPGTSGPLSIDFASSFDFGTQEITTQDMVYNSAAQKVNITDDQGVSTQELRPNYVQVSDNRGTETGWTLQVRQDAQFETTDNDVLDGAAIKILNNNVNTSSTSPVPSTVPAEIDLVPGTPSIVVAAKDAEGAGTYVSRFGKADDDNMDKSVQLSVPGSTTKYAKEYNTTLTWILTDTPVN